MFRGCGACCRRSRRQDVRHGDPLRQCRGFNAKGAPVANALGSAQTPHPLSVFAVEKRLRETVQFGVEGSSTFLECQPRSPQASLKWLFQGEGKRKLVGRQCSGFLCVASRLFCFLGFSSFFPQLSRAGGVLKTDHGILLKSLNQSDAGLYHCLATENNFKHTVARVALRILDRDIVLALTARDEEERKPQTEQAGPYAQSPAAPAPFPPEIRLINQYCQSYWDQLSPKPQQQQRKRTSRRHTEGQDQGLG